MTAGKMSIKAILAQRRSDLASAIAAERTAHYQLGKKSDVAALDRFTNGVRRILRL